MDHMRISGTDRWLTCGFLGTNENVYNKKKVARDRARCFSDWESSDNGGRCNVIALQRAS